MRTFRRSVLVVALVTSIGCFGPATRAAEFSPAPLEVVSNSQPAKTSPNVGLLLGLLFVGAYVVLIVAGRGN